jgi:hypothetical protein
MFVPVACNRCAKPFQVPDADAGKTVACPWCGAAVPALPVAGSVLPQAPAGEPPAPLSLDDAPPAPPADPALPRRRPGPPVAVVVLGVALLLLLVVIGVGVLGYRSGRIPESAWRSYTAPDKSFTVELPGEPTAEPLNPLPGVPGLGGEMFTARGWYSGADAWVGWRDVQPVVAAAATGNPEVWLLYRPAIDAELERQAQLWNGKVTRGATVRFDHPLTVEVQMSTPEGNVVERMIVVGVGPRTRLYVVGMRAKNLAPDSAAVRRMFDSFRANPK